MPSTESMSGSASKIRRRPGRSRSALKQNRDGCGGTSEELEATGGVMTHTIGAMGTMQDNLGVGWMDRSLGGEQAPFMEEAQMLQEE